MLALGAKVVGGLALGDAVGGAHRHVVVGVERVVGIQVGVHIGEGTDVAHGDRQVQRLHDHLGELLAGDRVVRAEGAVGIAADDAPGGQIGDGGIVGVAGRDVAEAGGRSQSQRYEEQRQSHQQDSSQTHAHRRSSPQAPSDRRGQDRLEIHDGPPHAVRGKALLAVIPWVSLTESSPKWS